MTSNPDIFIETQAFDDSESGRTILHPVIRAEVDGYSLGVLALNELADLHQLRLLIDRYISANGIQNNTI